MWQISVYGILVHPVEPMIWIRCASDGYRLPGFTYAHGEDPYLGNQFEGRLMPGYGRVFGCALYLLGNLCERKSNETRAAKLVCALEIKEGEPTGGRWVDLEAASPANFALEEHGELVQQTLVDLTDEGEAPRHGKLWNRRGMLRETATPLAIDDTSL